MEGITKTQEILWALQFAVQVGLVFLLFSRRTYRDYPVFFLYQVVEFLQNPVLWFSYHHWGHASVSFIAWMIFWISQCVVLCTRAAAVAELCWHILGSYRGVWAMAWRVLCVCAGILSTYSLLVSRHSWIFLLPNSVRALEIAIASVIVVLLAFAHLYHVKVASVDRLLLIGFCLYSCFTVLNDAVVDRFLYQYDKIWDALSMITYMATMFVWIRALRLEATKPAIEPIMLPGLVYHQLSPEINLRLKVLNEQLSHFWHVGEKET